MSYVGVRVGTSRIKERNLTYGSQVFGYLGGLRFYHGWSTVSPREGTRTGVGVSPGVSRFGVRTTGVDGSGVYSIITLIYTHEVPVW